jgi:SAM-dependent methyltransferase
MSSKKSLHVAVVGGTPEEYELAALRKVGFDINFDVFGIDADSVFLDLNSEIPKSELPKSQFDLVLCSQVLEHTWNLDAVFRNLTHFISHDTLIWLAAPASNKFHGSPEFYSAGYTEVFIAQNFEKLGVATLQAGHIGTKRNYFATHLLPRWLSVRSHAIPLFFSFGQGRFIANIYFTVKFFPWTLLLLLVSPRISSDPKFATESWFLGARDASHLMSRTEKQELK